MYRNKSQSTSHRGLLTQQNAKPRQSINEPTNIPHHLNYHHLPPSQSYTSHLSSQKSYVLLRSSPPRLACRAIMNHQSGPSSSSSTQQQQYQQQPAAPAHAVFGTPSKGRAKTVSHSSRSHIRRSDSFSFLLQGQSASRRSSSRRRSEAC